VDDVFVKENDYHQAILFYNDDIYLIDM
jgi:hypothetical protein